MKVIAPRCTRRDKSAKSCCRIPRATGTRFTRRSAFVLAISLAGCASVPVPAPEVAQPDAAAIAAGAAAAAATRGNGSPPASSAPGAARSPTAAVSAAAGAAAAAAAAAQGQKPFAEVVKGAKEMPGLFRLYQKDDKVWIEIGAEQFDQPYFFKSGLNQGIGEQRIYGGAMVRPIGVAQVVTFRRIGSNVQLIVKNTKYWARTGTPEALAVAAGFSDSLLATAPVASLPHPDRKSVLIEANALLLADIPAAASVLERTYRQSYSFDARNSSIGKVTATPDNVALEVTAHYSLARLALPPPPPAQSTLPPPPSTLPDVRSLFLGYHYTFATLPAEPMHPRAADDRIGYFATDRFDFTSDVPRVPVEHYVSRWRLEKKDPSAELSEPKRPIVYWLDRTIPVRYRDPIRAGILEWNKAFEKIGFKDAIRVEIQPDDADFDTTDIRHASVRWQTVAKSGYGAIGPRIVDPRTGEILDADIGIDANSVRAVRNLRREYVPEPPAAAVLPSGRPGSADAAYCEYGDLATQEAAFGLSLLDARGELGPDGVDVDRFVAAYLKDVAMHETGHTLGLRHNFRASTAYSERQLADREFTRQSGISGSVMEYNPWNIAPRGARQGEYQMSTLGPYDYWAIEFGYREIPPEQESAVLAQVAARSGERYLAYATDEDVLDVALDPDVNMMDLGDDPLAYAVKRLALVRELWQRTESMQLAPGERYSILRRNFTRGLVEARQGVTYATKYVGGVTTLRDRAGSGRTPLAPVDVARQRAALQMLAREVLSADSFSFPPAFLRNMAVSPSDIDDAEELGRSVPPVDLPIDQQVLQVQRNVLTTLMSPAIAQRLINNGTKVDVANQALQLDELYGTLHAAIWSELRTGRDISLYRRNLQREYTMLVAGALVRPSGSMPADARAQLRADAKTLRREIAGAESRSGISTATKAHLAETLSMLDEALKAPLVRQGV